MIGANALSGQGSSYDFGSAAAANGDTRFGHTYGPQFGSSGFNLSTPVLLGGAALIAVYFLTQRKR